MPRAGTWHDHGVDDAPAYQPPNWKALLGEIGLARMRLDNTVPHIYPLTIPHVGATQAQVDAAGARLGHPLDAIHRELLTYANGWPELFVHTDLLSTEELGAPGMWTDTQDVIASVEEDWPPGYAPPASELETIGASRLTTDVFMVWREGPLTGGGRPIIWFGSGQMIERWHNAADFMRSVLAYTLRTVEDVRTRRPPFDTYLGG